MSQPDPWSPQAQGQPYGPNHTAPLPAATSSPQQAYGDAYAPYNAFDQYSGQMQPPPVMPPQAPPPRRKNTGLIVGVIVCALLLAGVIGLGVVLANRSGDSSTSAASTSTRPDLPTIDPGNPQMPLPSLPNLPDLDTDGSTMGTINSVDGSSLQVKTLAGENVRIKTDSQTKVISLAGSRVSDLKVGNLVMVQGKREGDGAILASTIISLSLGEK